MLAALSSAVASPAESVPMACEIASIDIASHVEVPVNAPAFGQPKEPSPSIDTCFTIFNFNVQGLSRNLGELDAVLAQNGYPTFVTLIETWLDRTCESICLSGYHLVSMLDRRVGMRLDRGGIILFARNGFELSIVHVENSDVDERSWFIVHADCGPILLRAWYRRHCKHSEVESIRRFD